MIEAGRSTSTDTQPRRRCVAMRADGTPCRGFAVHFPQPGAGYCYAHSPLRDAETARRERRKGGEQRSNRARALKHAPADLKGLLASLYAASERLQTGELSPAQANSLSNIAAAAVRVVEVVEIEREMAELREALAPNRPISRPALPSRPERASQFATASTIARDEEAW